jgi:hypothetical protein
VRAERSGVVIFTIVQWLLGRCMSEVCAFSIHTRAIEKVVSNGDGSGDQWGNIQGYENTRWIRQHT